MRDALELAIDWVRSPSRAAERLKTPGGLAASGLVYAAVVAAEVLFYWFKPWDFPKPEPGATLPYEAARGGLAFWIRVHALWGTGLAAADLVFIAFFCGLLRRVKAPMAALMGLCLLLSALPLGLLVLHGRGMIGRAAFVGGWIALLAAAAPTLRSRGAGEWRSLAALVLSSTALVLALLPAEALVVAFRWETLRLSLPGAAYEVSPFKVLFYGGQVWTVAAATVALAGVEGLPTPRAFAAILCASVSAILLVFSLHLLGWIPLEVLMVGML